MKAKTLKISRIVVTTLFSISTAVILYESVCPADWSVITPVSDLIKDVLNSFKPAKEVPLESITITNKFDYINPNKNYSVFYELNPNNATNADIAYENLTPEYLDVYKDFFIAKNNPNDIQPNDAVGKIKVYSVSNPDINEIYEFKIRKTAPNNLKIRSNLTLNNENKTYTAYTNEEAYFDYEILENKNKRAIMYSSPINLEFDDTYFDKLGDTKLIPKKIGTTKVRVFSRDFPKLSKEVLVNIKSRDKLNTPYKLTLFNDINEMHYLEEGEEPLVKRKWEFAIVDKDNNKLDIPFKIRLNNDISNERTPLHLFNDNWVVFNKRDEFSFTADLFGDYKGLSLTSTFTPRHIYTTPIISSPNLDKENLTITMSKLSSEKIDVRFPGGTFSGYYAKSSRPNIVKVINQSGIRLIGVSGGRSYVRILPTEKYAETHGFEPIVIEVTVTTPMFKDETEFGLRFRKSIGHMLGFLVDCILLTLTIYLRNDGKKRWWLIGLVLPFGFIFGGVTELLQMIQPSRGPSFMDVGIDMIGWSIGFTIILVILLIMHFVKCNKNKSKNNDLIEEKHN